MGEGYTVTARYGAAFYDPEVLWVQMYGSEQDKQNLHESRSKAFNARLEEYIGTKLAHLVGRDQRV